MRRVSIAVAFASLQGCGATGGSSRDIWGAWVEARVQTAEFFCRCAIEDGLTEISLTQCIDEEVHPPTQVQLTCRERALAAHAGATEVVECWTAAERTYAACVSDLGCDDGGPPPFTCGGGEQVAASQRCDGFEHCVDGSDEVDCPPPFACGDGSAVPSAWVCDGFEDCPDAIDEAGCPTSCGGAREDSQRSCGDLGEAVVSDLGDCDTD